MQTRNPNFNMKQEGGDQLAMQCNPLSINICQNERNPLQSEIDAEMDEKQSQTQEESASSKDGSDDNNNKEKKKYSVITQEVREKFIQKVIMKQVTIKEAAKEFGLKFSNSKAILQTFKKEGRIGKKKTRQRKPKLFKKASSPSEQTLINPHIPQVHDVAAPSQLNLNTSPQIATKEVDNSPLNPSQISSTFNQNQIQSGQNPNLGQPFFNQSQLPPSYFNNVSITQNMTNNNIQGHQQQQQQHQFQQQMMQVPSQQQQYQFQQQNNRPQQMYPQFHYPQHQQQQQQHQQQMQYQLQWQSQPQQQQYHAQQQQQQYRQAYEFNQNELRSQQMQQPQQLQQQSLQKQQQQSYQQQQQQQQQQLPEQNYPQAPIMNEGQLKQQNQYQSLNLNQHQQYQQQIQSQQSQPQQQQPQQQLNKCYIPLNPQAQNQQQQQQQINPSYQPINLSKFHPSQSMYPQPQGVQQAEITKQISGQSEEDVTKSQLLNQTIEEDKSKPTNFNDDKNKQVNGSNMITKLQPSLLESPQLNPSYPVSPLFQPMQTPFGSLIPFKLENLMEKRPSIDNSLIGNNNNNISKINQIGLNSAGGGANFGNLPGAQQSQQQSMNNNNNNNNNNQCLNQYNQQLTLLNNNTFSNDNSIGFNNNNNNNTFNLNNSQANNSILSFNPNNNSNFNNPSSFTFGSISNIGGSFNFGAAYPMPNANSFNFGNTPSGVMNFMNQPLQNDLLKENHLNIQNSLTSGVPQTSTTTLSNGAQGNTSGEDKIHGMKNEEKENKNNDGIKGESCFSGENIKNKSEIDQASKATIKEKEKIQPKVEGNEYQEKSMKQIDEIQQDSKCKLEADKQPQSGNNKQNHIQSLMSELAETSAMTQFKRHNYTQSFPMSSSFLPNNCQNIQKVSPIQCNNTQIRQNNTFPFQVAGLQCFANGGGRDSTSIESTNNNNFSSINNNFNSINNNCNSITNSMINNNPSANKQGESLSYNMFPSINFQFPSIDIQSAYPFNNNSYNSQFPAQQQSIQQISIFNQEPILATTGPSLNQSNPVAPTNQ